MIARSALCTRRVTEAALLFATVSASSTDATFVELVIEVGHTLGLALVAKGVETDEQLVVLAGLECDQVQGFRFSQALPPAGLEGWVRDAPDEPRPGRATAAKLAVASGRPTVL